MLANNGCQEFLHRPIERLLFVLFPHIRASIRSRMQCKCSVQNERNRKVIERKGKAKQIKVFRSVALARVISRVRYPIRLSSGKICITYYEGCQWFIVAL